MLRRDVVQEAAQIAAWTMACLMATMTSAWAADAVLKTDYLSQLDPAVVGAMSGLAGGTIRALRSDVATMRALMIDAVPGALAGGFAWPLTLAIFGPVLATLQSTTEVALTYGAKIGVSGLLTGACLSVLIGAAESVFEKFRGGQS